MPRAQFVHIGDVHLQSTSSRNSAKLQALDQIIAEGLQLESLAGWLIPGDLFHQRSTVEDRNDWAPRLTRMANAAPVWLCDGNHDAPGDLHIFAKLKATWPIVVQSTPGVVRLSTPMFVDAAVAILPYPTRAGLVSAGVPKAEVIPTAADLLDVILLQLETELLDAAQHNEIPLFMGHVNIAGSLASSGQPQVGREIELDAPRLGRVPALYKALNHIHLAQEIGGGVYAGSIAPMSWGEVERKTYNVITCTFEPGGAWSATWEARRITTAPLYHVEGLLTRDGFTWQVTAGPGGEVQAPPASWRGCEVRVRYKFAQSEKSVLAQAQVLVEFTDAARLEVEPIAVPDRALRSPEVAAARTLAEKLAAYQQAPALSSSLAAKLAALEHSEPLALLSTIQTELADIEAGESEVVAA